MALLRAASVEEMGQEGRIKRVKAGGREYALINSGGRLYCIDGTCTHRGGPLCEGKLNGFVLTCPWHQACSRTCLPSTALRPTSGLTA